MTITLDLQNACTCSQIPKLDQFSLWLDTVLLPYNKSFEVTIRLVDEKEIHQLNHQYRQKDKATNVLSFPFEVPDGIDLDLLGDLVICADIVNQEAVEQKKSMEAHWAHMVIHGCLHLLGYDHINDQDAQEMEAIEISLLSKLGYSNPYEI
jgi:probable rRNA maturation factor